MAAAYPGAVKTFTTKNTNDVVEASHINDLQAEITALEDALVGTARIAHHLLFTDATYDIGASGATRPRDLFLSRNAVIGGTALITGVATHTAQAVFNGGATFAGNLIATDATYDIGASGATRFRDLFLSRNAIIGGTLGVTGVATFTAQDIHNAGIDLSGAASGQIKFPATQNGSADANTLDDYEEGTWTPVIGGSGGTSGQTYTSQIGRYTKIGREVYFTALVQLSAKGTITSAVEIQGLPFTAGATTYASCPMHWDTLATNMVNVCGLIIASTAVITVYGITAAAASSRAGLSTTDIDATTAFFVSGHYSV